MSIIGRYLSSDDVVLGLDIPDKDRALAAAALRVERCSGLDHAAVYRALWRREQLGSTAVGHGLAIPHARINGIDRPIVLLMRPKTPIAFGAADQKPVSSLLVILVPEQANDEHLQILADASQLFSDPTFRERLDAANDPAAIQHLFGAASRT